MNSNKKIRMKVYPYEREAKETTQAGWTGFIFGLIVGMMLVIMLTAASSPNCYEDEVIVWTGETHDLCVPIDKFQER